MNLFFTKNPNLIFFAGAGGLGGGGLEWAWDRIVIFSL